MAACVQPAAAVRDPTAAAKTGLKRKRIAVGSTEQYEFDETCRLGAGNFGAVFKARHRATGQVVAMKRPSPAEDSHTTVLREAHFLQDACCGGANPFVVGFRGVVRDPVTWKMCLVMECAATSLHDLLLERPRRSPPLTEATVRAAMWQLLTGAKKMHDDAHIIHRDIKPQNILVDEDQSIVKICDFGLAISIDELPPYEPAGTLWYKAPEILLEKTDYDAKVDVWSLGCVMAELINNGRPLFQRSNDDTQLFAIFKVLGMPDDSMWLWFSSTPFAKLMALLDMPRNNLLRDLFPETKLSQEGFEVLSGLLTCNPDKRLTAAAALQHQWFAKVDALEILPKKEKLASTLPKPHKRQRMRRVVCV